MSELISSSSMASLFLTSSSSSSSSSSIWAFKNNPSFRVSITRHPCTNCPKLLFSHHPKPNSRRRLNFSAKDEEDSESSSFNSSVTISPEEIDKVESSSEVVQSCENGELRKGGKQQEVDLKTDEEELVEKVKNEVGDPSYEESRRENDEELMGSPSFDEEIKIHTKRAAEKLLEFDIEGFLKESNRTLKIMNERSKKEAEEIMASLEMYKENDEELEKLKIKMEEAIDEFEQSEVEKFMEEEFLDPTEELDLGIGDESLADMLNNGLKKVIRLRKDLSKMYNMKRVRRRIKFEKKLLGDLKNELEHKTGTTPVKDLWRKGEMERLERKIDKLKKSEEAYRTLDLKKIKSCFGYDTFFVTDVGRFGDEGILVGKLMKPVEEILPELEKKVSEVVGEEVVLSFAEEESNGITSQVCMVRLKTRMNLEYEPTELSLTWTLVLCAAGFGILSSMGGFVIKPDATFGYYLANIVPLIGGLLSVWGVSTIATRITAACYGVKLETSFLDPPNFLSQLPNKKALFDISFAHVASAYVTSFLLAAAASTSDGSFNGSGLALYLRPQFFDSNPLFSLIPFVLGLGSNDPWNSLGYAIEELQVPVNPLSLAGLLGIVVTSLRLLPIGRFEGGRIAQALFGKYIAEVVTLVTLLLIIIGALRGSIVCVALFICASKAYEEEMPAKDEITPLGDDRLGWGFVLAAICFLTLFPNSKFSFLSLPFSSGAL